MMTKLENFKQCYATANSSLYDYSSNGLQTIKKLQNSLVIVFGLDSDTDLLNMPE